MLKDIKAVVFDADDTLWSNEPLFRAAERHFFETMSDYGTLEWLNAELYKTEVANMEELGYGAKAFIISHSCLFIFYSFCIFVNTVLKNKLQLNYSSFDFSDLV